jgi:phosphoribosylformylglycinamidine cyclo-ligase
VVVAADQADAVMAALVEAGEDAFRIGHIAVGEKGCTVTGTGDTWSAMGDWSAVHYG